MDPAQGIGRKETEIQKISLQPVSMQLLDYSLCQPERLRYFSGARTIIARASANDQNT